MLNPPAESGVKTALLVGINRYYQDEAIGNLKYCVNDVVDLGEILSGKLRGDFRTEPLHSEMPDGRLTPTRSNIMSMVKLLSSNASENDSILFYFAGHGFEQDRANYLLPADARLNVLPETAIPLTWIKQTLSESLARKKFMIIDACHAGSRLGRAAPSPMTKSFQEEMFSQAEGLAIMASCQIGQLSYDLHEKDHGVFSYYLLEGLKGPADHDSDHIITVPDANNYVSTKMREWSLRTHLQQNPTFEYHVSGDFILVRVPVENMTKVSSYLTIQNKGDQKTVEEDEQEAIRTILEDISFMSDQEADARVQTFEKLESYIFGAEDNDKTVKRGTSFLRHLITARLQGYSVKKRVMEIVAKVTELKEIKRLMRSEPRIRQYLILEYVTSASFEYAGTMARVISNIFPALSDEELFEVVKAIEENDQIANSFVARRYLVSIIDGCKIILPLEKYRMLKTKYF